MRQYQLPYGNRDDALPCKYMGEQGTDHEIIPLAGYRMLGPYFGYPLFVLSRPCARDVLQNVIKLFLTVKVELLFSPNVSEKYVLVNEIVWT